MDMDFLAQPTFYWHRLCDGAFVPEAEFPSQLHGKQTPAR